MSTNHTLIHILFFSIATTNFPLDLSQRAMMIKFMKNSQVLVLFVLALLLAITPLLPSSLRPTYLYFIFNVLIIALGAEAGLLSAFSKPLEDRKQPQKLAVMPSEVLLMPEKKEGPSMIIIGASSVSEQNEKKSKVVEKYASERVIISSVNKVDKVKKCPSMPSLFFIGGGEEDDAEEFLEEEVEEEAEDEIGGVNGQELFAKAEAFIGKFYKQLKMQREESWTYY